jgi:hypothetical protein
LARPDILAAVGGADRPGDLIKNKLVIVVDFIADDINPNRS